MNMGILVKYMEFSAGAEAIIHFISQSSDKLIVSSKYTNKSSQVFCGFY